MKNSFISTLRRRTAAVTTIGAFLAIYVGWGSTFLAARVAVEVVPPFLVAGIRSGVAGALLLVVAYLVPGWKPLPWRPAVLAGVLMFVGGQGLVGLGLQSVPSGPAAVILATIPLWMLLLSWKRRSHGYAVEIAGIVAGLGGVALMSLPSGMAPGSALALPGVLALLVAAVSWAAATTYTQRTPLRQPSAQGTGMMLVAGGCGAVLVAASRGEFAVAAARTWNFATFASLGYLVVIGSVVGFGAYMWLLGRESTVRVASYAFVNPVVAVLVGWQFGGEPLTPRVVLATVITVIGVVLVVLRPRQSVRPAWRPLASWRN